jgi:diadenosine tetraphosphate (Ap4A) HIT family hydrolase
MATLFTKIINGEIPGRFVWKDEQCVAFLTIEPLKPGHTLVVPRQEVDHWLDARPALLSHLMHVAQNVGKAIQEAFPCPKVGMMLVGLEVPHMHIHLAPIHRISDLDFANADRDANAEDLDAAAEKIRAVLRKHGHHHVAD